MNDNNNTTTEVKSTNDQTRVGEIAQLTLQLAMLATENQGGKVDENLINAVANVVVDNQKKYNTGVKSDNLNKEIPNRDDQDSSNQKSLLENIIEDSSKNLKHARESFLECFIPNLSSNKDTQLNDQSKEQSQPSSVFENIGINISHALRKTQDDSKILGNDLIKLLMLDRILKENNDSQNR